MKKLIGLLKQIPTLELALYILASATVVMGIVMLYITFGFYEIKLP